MVTAATGCVGVAGTATVARGAGSAATVVDSAARGFGGVTGVGLLAAIGACGVGLAAMIGAGVVGVAPGICGTVPGVACGVAIGGTPFGGGGATDGVRFAGGGATGVDCAPFGGGATGGTPFAGGVATAGAPLAGWVAVGGAPLVGCVTPGVDCAPFGVFTEPLGVEAAAPPPEEVVGCAAPPDGGTPLAAPAPGDVFVGGMPLGGVSSPDAAAPCATITPPIVPEGSSVAPPRAVIVRPGLFAAVPATRLASVSSVAGSLTVSVPFAAGVVGRCAVVTPARPRDTPLSSAPPMN